MGNTLREIAEQLRDSDKKVQLIYAFNGSGKTRLSREFKELVAPKSEQNAEDWELANKKIVYYNAFTEDLFYWDNDLQNDAEPKLKIQPNSFTKWIFEDQGQDSNIIKNFQYYTDAKLSPKFNAKYTTKDSSGKDITVNAFSEVVFSYERGNDDHSDKIKISKGEESCLIWSIFYTFLEQVVAVLNVAEESLRDTNQFNNLEYVFVDDPVTSLDENHLVEIAVNLAEMIKGSKSDLKFIITTHNPLFYNVLSNQFNNADKEVGYKPDRDFKKFTMMKDDNNGVELAKSSDSPFSYHIYLLNEVRSAIEKQQISKYHFSFLRNILEKTSTFLGYSNWGDLITPIEGDRQSYIRKINALSHSKHSAEETYLINESDKKVLGFLVDQISKIYKFYEKKETESQEETK